MRYLATLTFLTIAILATTVWHHGAESFASATEHGAAMKHDHGHVDMALGKDVYERVCSACHDNGVAGAIKITDKKTWRSHAHHGIDHMVEAVIKGKGAMPARGGDPKLSDEEIESAVHYIIQQTQ